MTWAQTIYSQCAQGPNESRYWCHTWWVPASSNYSNNLHNYHDDTMSIIHCQNKAINLMVMEKTKIKQVASSLLTNCINFVHPAHVNSMLCIRRAVEWHRTHGLRIQGPNESRCWCHTWWVPALSKYTNNLHDSCGNIMQRVYFQNKTINDLTMEKLKMKIELVSRSMANCIDFIHPAPCSVLFDIIH